MPTNVGRRSRWCGLQGRASNRVTIGAEVLCLLNELTKFMGRISRLQILIRCSYFLSKAFTVWAFKTAKLPGDLAHDSNSKPEFVSVSKYLVNTFIAQFPPHHDLCATKQGHARPPNLH